MGKCFLYGNGPVGGKASLTVYAPEGSLVTISMGDREKSGMVSGDSVVFKGLTYGTWTVTASLDGETASSEVTLTEQSVTLEYKLWLYKDGDLCGYAWTARAYGADSVLRAPTVTNGSELSIVCDTTTYAEGVAYIGLIDLTEHESLHILANQNPVNTTLYIWSKIPSSLNDGRVLNKALSGASEDIDVSGLSGTHAIGFYVRNGSSSKGSIHIGKLYLER